MPALLIVREDCVKVNLNPHPLKAKGAAPSCRQAGNGGIDFYLFDGVWIRLRTASEGGPYIGGLKARNHIGD